VVVVILASTAGAAAVVAAAELQRRHRFGLSLALLQGPNLALLVAAGLAIAVEATSARLPLLITAGGFLAGGIAGWTLLLRERPVGSPQADIPWGEALALAGANGSATLLGQLDRLLIPQLLPLSHLATYGAISSVAGSLFRVLQRGVGYALLPRLRAAGSVGERRRLLAGEAKVVGVIVLAGAVVVWGAVPLVEHWVLRDKYEFSDGLVVAVLAVGLAKILAAVTRAAATALADRRELSLVNLSGWAAVALAIVSATAGARWGLPGVVYGVGLGWLLRSAATLLIVLRHLRLIDRRPGAA
jgi:hypothetical protein